MPRKIIKANITHISFVPKAANGTDFALIKSNDGAKEMPIIKMDEEQRLVTGVVYAPDIEDAHGEYMEADAIEKAAHEFMINHRKTDINHNFQDNENVEVVESYVAKADFELNGQQIKKGTWLVTTFIKDDLIWKGIKSGEFNGYSMGGSGVREPVREDGLLKKFASFEESILKKVSSLFKSEGEEDMTKSEVEELIKAAMNGQAKTSEEPENITKSEVEELIKAAMKKPEDEVLTKADLIDALSEITKAKESEYDALQKSVEDFKTQMQTLAKSRGLSNQLSALESVTKTDNSLFNGLKF